jgi:hypothetical protein
VNERDRRGVNGPARKVARPASPSTLTAPRSAILLGGSCLRPLRGQSSLQLADAPVLFGDDLDQGRDKRDRQNRRLLAAALERIAPQLEDPRQSSQSRLRRGRQCALRRPAGALRREHRGRGGGGCSAHSWRRISKSANVGTDKGIEKAADQILYPRRPPLW